MYAIIRTGGRQAKVAQGDILDIEHIKGEEESLSFTPLLVVKDDGSTISGREDLAQIKVGAKVLGESRGPKIDMFKYKAKTGYRRRSGHRQIYTTIEITGIDLPKVKKVAKAAEAEIEEG